MPERSNQYSPLQRRIARHTSLATLFRQPALSAAAGTGLQGVSSGSPANQQGGWPGAQPGEQPAAPIKARLLPAGSRLPEAILLPRLPVASQLPTYREELPPVAMLSGTEPAPIQTAPDASGPDASGPEPTEPALSVQTTRVDPAPPSTSRVETASPQGADDEDRNWRRLQTIFRRHQEQGQAGDPASAAPRPPAPPSGEPGDPGLAPSGPPVARPDTQELQSSLTAAPSESPADTQTPALPAPASGSIQRQPAGPLPEPGQPQAPGLSTEGAPASDTPVRDEPQPSGELQSSASQPPQAGQTLPLEAVWPVQRAPQEPPPGPGEGEKSRQQPAHPQAAPAYQPTSPPAPPAPAAGEADSARDRYLQEARAGQPGSSSIEVIPPRRPHPLRRIETSPEPDTSQPEPERRPQPPAEAQTTQIQTQKELSRPETHAQESGPDLPQPRPGRQVQTEIGPLPEDLWRLLGEEPPREEDDTAPFSPAGSPAGASQPPAASQQLHRAGAPTQAAGQPLGKPPGGPPGQPFSQSASIQRAIAAAESRPEAGGLPPVAGPAPAAPLKDVLPPIQRLSAPVTSTRGEATPTAGKGEGVESGQKIEDDLDLDELARQVYSQVRRRLDLEFERLHHRR